MGGEYNLARRREAEARRRAAMGHGELRTRLSRPTSAARRPLVLDGALGTELERRGVATGLPLWSARALLARRRPSSRSTATTSPLARRSLTANTFRTPAPHARPRGPRRARRGAHRARAAPRAVAPPREAARPVFVAGSAAPLEDCYRPDLVPGDEALAREHAEHAEQLAAAGADCDPGRDDELRARGGRGRAGGAARRGCRCSRASSAARAPGSSRASPSRRASPRSWPTARWPSA